ncbi:MAG TPA: hypothetical protein GXZ61_00830 [Clostridiales bacterium]|jgi:hypothetical protein|nr:hypothetical protein [Clostridiales bacterium]
MKTGFNPNEDNACALNEASDKSLNDDKTETGICKNAEVMFTLHLLLKSLFFCFFSFK